MPLTDQAMAAQAAPMPPQGGAPMGPAMMGAAPMPPQGGMPPVDPATGMPMDPTMMGAAPVPPQGGMPPVDPATGMPMDPAMAGASTVPPQGGMPPASTGDMVIDMLLSMGAMVVDPNGQPVPPEILSQLVSEMNAQTGGMTMGGATPRADPNSDVLLETMSQMEKGISILTDKLDSLRAVVDDMRALAKAKDQESSAEVDAMDKELQALLAEQAMAGQQNAPTQDTSTPEQAPLYQPLSRPTLSPEQLQQLGAMGAIQ